MITARMARIQTDVGDIDECSGFSGIMHIIPSFKHNQISIHPEIFFFQRITPILRSCFI